MKPIRLLFLLMLLLPIMAKADSPITSTDFYKVYTDVPMVETASTAKIMNKVIAEFLLSSKNPLHIKVAVINALGWDIDGKKNAKIFKTFLARKHKTNAENLDLEKLSGDELLCLGYLTVMDDYFKPDKAIPILEAAAKKNSDSFTVAIIIALTKAQKAMDSSGCDAWQVVNKVFEDKNLSQDMRPEAKQIIYDYMVLYQPECK